jgi:copper chaperone CopZ
MTRSGMSDPTSTLHATISGMHCINCAGAAERLLRVVPDVESARVYYPSGLAVIRHTQGFDVAALQVALAPDGYTLVPGVDAVPPLHETSFRDYGKIGAMSWC